MADTSALITFYRGAAPDPAGRMFDDIVRWDDRRLEMVHDYIQWLFPLPEPSRFNPAAPLLTVADMAAFKAEPRLRAQLLRALDRLLKFFGLVRVAETVSRAPNFVVRAAGWLTPLNHNHLRLTRIVLCLGHCGLPTEAAALLVCLEAIVAEDRTGAVTARTLDFWRTAVAA